MKTVAILLAALLASNQAGAEVVQVKYRGPVNLDGFGCESHPRSSVVFRTCYSQRDRYMVVSLKGTYYHYCLMPPAIVAAWREAPSMGRFYNERIKGDFDCRSGGVPQ